LLSIQSCHRSRFDLLLLVKFVVVFVYEPTSAQLMKRFVNAEKSLPRNVA